MEPHPLTLLQHDWIAIQVTPVVVMRRANGQLNVLVDPDLPAEVQVGCSRCDATPDEGWGQICDGEEISQ